MTGKLAVFDADPYLPGVCQHATSHTNQDLANPGTNAVIKRHHRAVETDFLDLYGVSLGVRYEGQRISVEQYEGLKADFQQVCRWIARISTPGAGRCRTGRGNCYAVTTSHRFEAPGRSLSPDR